MAEARDLKEWLRAQCAEYAFDLRGVYRRRGEHDWPLSAAGEDDLETQLAAGGHLLPLPKEPAALANVLEDFLRVSDTWPSLKAGVYTLRGEGHGPAAE